MLHTLSCGCWGQVEVGSLEEVIGKMQADSSGEWASVMFIPAGAGPCRLG